MTTVVSLALGESLRRRGDDALVTICAARPGREHHVMTGNQLDCAAQESADTLRAAFDPAAGPLALVMPSGAEFVTAMLGALYAGFTIVPLAAPRRGPSNRRFSAILRDCLPAAILCTDGLAARLEEVCADAATGGHLDGVGPVVPLGALADYRTIHPAGRNLPDDRPAIVQYTSGSTRAPRGVMLGAATVLANARLANGTWSMNENGRMLSWLPHFHDMGLLGGILYPLLSGGATALMDPLHMIQRPARWLHLIGELGATFSGGPAFSFAHCIQNIDQDQCAGLNLASWRTAFCGAEPVPAALMDSFRTKFGPYGLDPRAVFASYGLAEYTLMVAGGRHALRHDPPPQCAAIEPCRVAEEMRDNLCIVDPATCRLVGDGELGEVWLRGASAARGYLGRPEESTAVFAAAISTDNPAHAGPWLRTGDLAVLHGDYLYVTGRLKDLVFVNGQKIPASDIEWLAAEQDAALNPLAAAAVMQDDLANGKAILLIERRSRASVIGEEETVRRRIVQAIAGAWSIDLTDVRILAPGSLPRTSSGKIQRQLAAQVYGDKAVAGVPT